MDAIVLAGGRISGPYAEAAGTTVKALAVVRGEPVLRRVTAALQAASGIRRVCVVGPEAVRPVLTDGCLWEDETESALGNLLAGLERLGEAPSERALVCGSDVPALDAASVADFVARAPDTADIAMPLVRRESFLARFPGDPRPYVQLADGAYTSGSQFIVRPHALHANRPLLEALFQARKSQLGMVRLLGVGLTLRFLTRRLRIVDVEQRGSALTGCRCQAVGDCYPELAFDIDSLADLEYAAQWDGWKESK